MSENNPFADAGKPANKASKAASMGWIVAGLLAIVAGVTGYLWNSTRADHRDLAALRASLADAATNLTNAQADSLKSQADIAALKSQVADLEKQKENAVQAAKSLENEMRGDLESKDVTIANLQGRLTVSILDRVMFESGEAELQPDGQAVMQKIADILAKHPELKIQVVGHTDNIPIRAASRVRYASNWELSTARALAAVHYLTEQAGVDPRRVGAAGDGEYRPVADNATEEGRAKNRRIEITILPDELAQPGAPPGAKPAEATNAPPPVAPTPTPSP